jgi:mono/diheme cytochrome c family protein
MTRGVGLGVGIRFALARPAGLCVGIGLALALCVNDALAQVRSDGAGPAAMIERGRIVFEQYCTPCHGDGRGDDGAPMLPGTHALHLKYRGERPGLLEERTDLPAEAIRVFVRNGVASMPPFRKTEVTDEDIEAIAAYLAEAARGRRPE